MDDSVRHAMTKLSHIHFTTNEQATHRILGMGEEFWRVHTVGFPAIDLISEGRFAKPNEIRERLGIDVTKPIVLFTQHSVTTEFDKAAEQIEPSIVALRELASHGVQCLVTYPNNDAGGKAIIERLEQLKAQRLPNIYIKPSLGRYMYHGVLALAKNLGNRIACVGNSSSGLKETPAFGCPTVNIGSRQDGRLRGENVVDADYQFESIYKSAQKCLFDEEFRRRCATASNPYWMGDAGPKIANVLATVPLDQKLIRKKMTLRGEAKDGWFR